MVVSISAAILCVIWKLFQNHGLCNFYRVSVITLWQAQHREIGHNIFRCDVLQMAKVMEFMTSGNPLAVLRIDCDPSLQEWFYGAGALDSLDIDMVNADLCRSDMVQVMAAEVMDVYDVVNYMTEVSIVFKWSII